jgi:hypothetical protein
MKAFYKAKGAKEIVDSVDTNLCYIPVADVQPVYYGRWIRVDNGRGGHRCSMCDEYAPSYQSGNEYLSNYCPNCGARMKQEGEKR